MPDSEDIAVVLLPRLKFRLPLDPARLLRARERIRDYLTQHRIEGDTIDDVVLALEEAMTNAVRHSGTSEDLNVRLQFAGRDLLAEVRDHGAGFDVTSFDPGRLPDPLEPGGRGLFLMNRLMDEVELLSADGLEVRMVRKDVLPEDASSFVDSGRSEGAFAAAGTHRMVRQHVLLEEIDEAFAALDWEYRFVYVNEITAEMFGLPRDEFRGRMPSEIWPNMIGTNLDQALQAAMELGKPGRVQYWSVSGQRWYEARLYPTSNGVSVYGVDITENKRAEEALLVSRRRAELLAETAGALLASDDPQRLVEELCHALMTELDCQAFFNFLVDEELDCLRLNAYAGIPADEARRIELLDYGAAVCGRAAQDGTRIVIEDIGDTLDPQVEPVRAAGIQAYAAHPLMVEGRVLGTLSFGTRTRSRFSDEDLALMKTVADHVAIAMERKKAERKRQELIDELREAARLREHLNRINLGVTSLHDREEILRLVTAETARGLGAESSSISLFEDGAWVPRYGWNVDDRVLGVPIPRGRVAYLEPILSSHEVVVVEDCETDARVDLDLQHAWRVHSVIAAPLILHGRSIGAIFLNYHSGPHTFTPLELDFVTKAGAIISAAIESAQLVRTLEQVAQTLQENLIHPLPIVAGLELGRVSEAAVQPELVGGDFSHVFVIDEKHVGVLIGDVEGKGVLAAGLTETVHTAVSSFALIDTSPAFIFCKTNELLLQKLGEDGQFVTAFLVIVDLVTGEAAYVSAGHQPPVVAGPDGCRFLGVTPGLPLGTFPCAYETQYTQLRPGDCVVFVTDGVTEARRHGELFGERRLLETVRSASDRPVAELAELLRLTVIEFAGRLKDDLHILTLRRSEVVGG